MTSRVFGGGLNIGGANFTTAYLNNNGALSFTPYGGWGGARWCSYSGSLSDGNNGYPLLALWFSDLDTTEFTGSVSLDDGGASQGSNLVYIDYDVDNEALTLTWDDVKRYGSSNPDLAAQLSLKKLGDGRTRITYLYENTSSPTNSSTLLAGWTTGANYSQIPDGVDLDSTVGNTGKLGIWEYDISIDGVITDAVDASAPAPVPTIIAASYDATSGVLTVNVANLLLRTDGGQIIDTSMFAIQLENGQLYELTNNPRYRLAADNQSFTIQLNGSDQAALRSLFDADGLQSSGGTVYNLVAATQDGFAWNTDGNGNTAPTDDTTSIYVTGSNVDRDPPSLVDVSFGNSVDIGITENIVITFSEAVQAGDGHILIRNDAGTVVLDILSSDETQAVFRGSTLILNPTNALDFSTRYVIEIQSDAIEDLAGNSYSGFSDSSPSSLLSFTTGAMPVVSGDQSQTTASPAGVTTQHGDGDGHAEVTSKLRSRHIPSSTSQHVDVNADGRADYLQPHVTSFHASGDGSSLEDYGALVVDPSLTINNFNTINPGVDGLFNVTEPDGSIVLSRIPEGVTILHHDIVTARISGFSAGMSSSTMIMFMPGGLQLQEGDAYVAYNFKTNQYEEYNDSEGHDLYTLKDVDGDGLYDAVQFDLIDGDPEWDAGVSDGSALVNGFLVDGLRTITGTPRVDRLTGNLLMNTLSGGRKNDVLYGGLDIDILLGGKGRDRYVYRHWTESDSYNADRVRFGHKDLFDFTQFDGNLRRDGQQRLVFIGQTAFSGIPGQLRATKGLLEADLSGDGESDFEVVLTGKAVPAAMSFLF